LTVPIHIGSPDKKGEASILKPDGEKAGLNVLTRPAKVFENKIIFFVNETNGADMAVNADTLSNNEWVHDGIDNVYWTAAAISGTWIFNSAAQNHTPLGAQSIDATATVNNNTAQIVRGGGALALASPISALGIYIYITGWNAPQGNRGVSVVGWDTGAGAAVGSSVNISDYIDTTILNSWQHAIIPLTDMNLQEQSIDAIRIQTTVVSGIPPNYYLDDIEILEGDEPLEYIIAPDEGTWLYVDDINATIVDGYTGITTVAGATENATFPRIPYNSFLGLAALTNGILYQRINNAEVRESFTLKQLFDIIKLPGTEIVGYGGDGTNSWVKVRVKVTEPIVLKSENNDLLKMSISDDLSGLLELEMSCGCREEVRQGDLYVA